MTSHKKPGVAFWATGVVVAVLVLYPLSLGPMCWASVNGYLSRSTIDACALIYGPVRWFMDEHEMLATPLRWYLSLWIGP